MTGSADAAAKPGVIYTFYSYKGGVGRSMALANVGALLAKWGSRVLAVDWDLEAPGLEVFYERSAKVSGRREDRPGVVDLLETHAAGKPLDWKSCLLQVSIEGRTLDLISAGRRTEDYRRRVQQLNWGALFQQHHVGNYLDQLRHEWKRDYDFVLVDSRTGITDIGDICTVLLPDALVTLFVSNYQNLNGIRDAVTRARTAHRDLPVDRGRLVVVPVLARDEVYNEYEKSQEWKRIFAKELADLYTDWLPRGTEPRTALNKLFIPYVTNWSFGERLPVVEAPHEIENPTSISAGYGRLASLLRAGLDWKAVDAQADVYELEAARAGQSAAAQRVVTVNTKLRFLGVTAGVVLLLAVLAGILFFYRQQTADPGVAAAAVKSRGELEKLLAQPNPDWERIRRSLPTLVRSGEDLTGLKLVGADLRAASLAGADLSGVDLSGANLERADLGNAKLDGARLDRANLEGTNLRGVDIEKAVGLRPEQLAYALTDLPQRKMQPSK
ncbi:MAG TPA: pentapeptide repeat-containing protein [Candidatus Polarisedimenticolaceae bacterium]|nr:pentapeptide repeat-containing protein [Candidatus Polarisedimenticolaceae bacterium]